jgi:hypothetical protein
MADFPPAQYIDGYTATGNTISFTIAGYTGKKVASVTVTDGGSYTTPTASVAFSGGSGSGATATANMGLKTLVFSSSGASSLLEPTMPTSVLVTVTGGATANPIFGLSSVSPNTDLFFDITTTPTISLSGDNGTYTDATVSLNSSSSLHVASLTTPASGGGSYTPNQEVSVQIVDASNSSTVLGTATITTDNNGDISTDTVILDSWNTAQSKSTLTSYSLKLKSPTATLSSSVFAIKAVKMSLATASSRISVTNIGNGYTNVPQIQGTGLKTEVELINNAQDIDFDKKTILKEAVVLNNNASYTSAPTITVSGGGLSNTNVVKTLAYFVNSVSFTNGGLGYTSTPTVAISGSVSSGGANATGTATISTLEAISLPNLSEAEADPTTGDFREICHAICEMVNNINTESVSTSLQTTLQTNGTGIIDKFTFSFDLVPETGVLAVDPEP